MKKLFVRSVVGVALVVVSSLLIAGVALAGGEKWNKWQPIEHAVVSGEFKFSDDALLKIKEYSLCLNCYPLPEVDEENWVVVGDFVAYLAPYDSFEDFDNRVYDPICVPQGATGRTTFGAGWFAELTGRDMSDFGSGYDGNPIFTCLYPAGWHDAQE